MPNAYDLPRANENWDQLDIEKYNKLPFYLAYLGAKQTAQWPTWQKLYGALDWTPNQGNTLRGVIDEPSPVGRQEFLPNQIDTVPNKDVIELEEATADAVVRRHNFESRLIPFVGSFQDFKANKVTLHNKDIMRQIMIASDFFIRSYIFHHATSVIIPGASADSNGETWYKTSVPANTTPGASYLSTKDADFRSWAISELGNDGTLTYKLLKKFANFAMEDLDMMPFEGAYGATPKNNETIKGKMLYVGSNRTWAAVSEDDTVISRKPDNLDLIGTEFQGSVAGITLWKRERYPMRIAADGSLPAPEIIINNGPLDLRTRPNPAYVNAPYEVTFLCGAEAFKTIKVGPAPADFAKKQISADKFRSLKWNGEVRLTDDILVNYGGGVYDTNKYGEYVQLFADAVFGALAVNPDHVIPIIHKRSSLGD